MLELLSSALPKLLEILGEFLKGLFVYHQGAKNEQLKEAKESLELNQKGERIEETNLAKSDADVLNELLKHDSRRSP